MVININLPEINAKPTSTKDAIINLLSTEWPLTLRGIFYKIKKQNSYSFTYQAVYKGVKELVEQKILIRKGKEYEINIDWIKKVQSFTDIVETNYYAKKRLQNISGIKESKQKEDIIILNFETLFDAEKYLYYFMKDCLLKTKNDKIIFKLNSEWRPIYYLRTEYNHYRKLQKLGHKFYFSCFATSELEKQSIDFYKKIGVNYKILKKELPQNSIIFGDYYITIFIPEEIKKQIKKNLKSKDKIGLLKNALEKKSSIRIIITKDKSLASELKKQK